MAMPFEKYQTLGSQAIPGDSSVGRFIRDEPSYEMLEDEMRKRESMSGEAVDWAVVETQAATLLRDQTKDLRIAIYLCCALFEQYRHAGLVMGLKVVADLIENYWPALFPPLKTGAKALRARQAVLSWFADYLSPRLERAHVADPTQQNAAGVELARLIAALKAQSTALADLFETAQRYLPTTTQPEQQQAKAAVPPPKPPTPATSQADDIDLNAPRQVRQSLLKLAIHLLETEPATALPYHIIYHIAWRDVKSLPQHTDGVTQFSPVTMNRILEYRDMLAAGEYAHLLPKVANSFCNAPFWLDAHYFIANILEQLGHQRTLHIVEHEVRQFLTKMPQLVDMKFADGTPFVDDTTRQWLETLLVDNAADEDATAAAENNATQEQATAEIAWLTQLNQTAVDEADLSSIINQANTAAQAGDFITGLSQLEQATTATTHLRAQFIASLKRAGYCLRHSQAYTAHIQYQQLLHQAETYQLETWEPELMLEAAWGLMRTAVEIHGHLANVPLEQQAQYQQAHALLYRLDTRVAFHFNAFMEAENDRSPS